MMHYDVFGQKLNAFAFNHCFDLMKPLLFYIFLRYAHINPIFWAGTDWTLRDHNYPTS